MIFFINIEFNSFKFLIFYYAPRPTESGNQSFHLSRIHDTQIDLISGEVVLEIELELFHDDQKIFLGLMNTHRVNETSMSLQSGIGVALIFFHKCVAGSNHLSCCRPEFLFVMFSLVSIHSSSCLACL